MDSQLFSSTTPRRQLGQSFVSGSASMVNLNEPDTKSMQLQLIQQKHLIMKLEKENTTLQEKVSDLISQQFKNQRLIVDQKKQIADFSHNLHFLQLSIEEEDSPVKQVIQKLLNNDQSPKEFDKQLDVEKQIQMNSLQRENQQLKQKLQSVEEKLQNQIQRQFRDAANILKLKKDKSSLVEKLSITDKKSEQKGSAIDLPAVQVIISDIYSDVQNLDQVKEKFESLIQNYMVLYLTQQSNQQIELGESILKSHRSSSSRKVDQIQNLFSEILKLGNIETHRSRESVLPTQENQIEESFVQEKPQTLDKSSQTIDQEENVKQIHSAKRSQTIMTTSRVSPIVEVVNIDLKIDEEFKQNYFPPSTSSVVLLAAATNTVGENQNNACEKEEKSKNEKGSNEQGQTQAQVEDLINQLNYTKRQYYYAVDQCLQVKDELGRLKNVDEQLNFLAQQHTNTQKDLERYKVKFETLLNRYFQLEQSQKGQNAD